MIELEKRTLGWPCLSGGGGVDQRASRGPFQPQLFGSVKGFCLVASKPGRVEALFSVPVSILQMCRDGQSTSIKNNLGALLYKGYM